MPMTPPIHVPLADRSSGRRGFRQISGAGQIQDMTVTDRGPGGIAGELTVTGSDGTVTIKGQSAIRSALGNPSLIITKKDGGTMTGSATLPSALSPLRRGQGRTEAFPSIYMEAVLAMVWA